MANNYDDYGYEGDNNSGLFKKILIVVMVIVAILIIIFLIKSCGNGSGGGDNTFDYESALLNAGKIYYEGNKSEYPNQVGECTKVELKTLIHWPELRYFTFVRRYFHIFPKAPFPPLAVRSCRVCRRMVSRSAPLCLDMAW